MRLPQSAGEGVEIIEVEGTITSLEGPLDRKILASLHGEFMPLGASPLAEEALRVNGLGAIASAARLLADTVEEHGYAAEYRYCKSELFKHPVPVLTVCAQNGAYIVPGRAMLALIGATKRSSLERADTRPPQKSLLAKNNVEEFSPESPVKCLVVPEVTGRQGIRVLPIFSDKARVEACSHAAQFLRGRQRTSPSYVLDEVIVREARSRGGAFSEAARVDLVDDGTHPFGDAFQVIAHIRQGKQSISIPIKGSIIEVAIELALR